jgi:hypothetical protein
MVGCDEPAGHAKPGWHCDCCRLAASDGQKKPAAHAFAVALDDAAARQKPATHAVHELAVVKADPPPDHEPGAHAVAAGNCAPVPVGQ